MPLVFHSGQPGYSPVPAKTNGLLTEHEVRDNIIQHHTRLTNTRFVEAFRIAAQAWEYIQIG